MDIDVWIIPKTKTVLVTDDPAIPVAACVTDDEPRENAGSVWYFTDIDDAMYFAERERDERGYALQESWRFAPWADPYYVGREPESDD